MFNGFSPPCIDGTLYHGSIVFGMLRIHLCNTWDSKLGCGLYISDISVFSSIYITPTSFKALENKSQENPGLYLTLLSNQFNHKCIDTHDDYNILGI